MSAPTASADAAPRPRSTILDLPLLVLGLLVAIAAPLLLHTSYWVRILILICIFAIVNQAWNLIMGYAGIWSFEQITFIV